MKSLFCRGSFQLHSGGQSHWKVECDALTNEDWAALAFIGLELLGWPRFKQAVGVPRGGLRLAQALQVGATGDGPTLIADDVLSTGASMESLKSQTEGECIGLVVFARGPCPSWVRAIWRYGGIVTPAPAASDPPAAGATEKPDA